MSGPSTVFLTGFPGFIAERLVARLAEPDTQFFLLVQPAFVGLAKVSIENICQAKNVPLENFVIVRGDITQPDLGLSPEALEAVRGESTDVFHLAAIYDLEVAKELARKVNVEGTRNVNELVRSLPLLRRYNYISTCYVAGKRDGRILETELEHDAGFRNYYEETKYLAELDVETLKRELPITIFRPSVVVGDSRTGETAKYDGVYYLILYLRRAPSLLRLVNVGNPNVRLNLVPVDFVVDGIAALSQDREAMGKTFALADPRPLATSELFDVIAQNLSARKSIVTPPAALTEWSLNLPFSPAITGLPHAGVPYFFLSQTYDTAVADELLEKHGIRCPDFREYAPNLIRYVNDHPKL